MTAFRENFHLSCMQSIRDPFSFVMPLDQIAEKNHPVPKMNSVNERLEGIHVSLQGLGLAELTTMQSEKSASMLSVFCSAPTAKYTNAEVTVFCEVTVISANTV